MENKQLKAAIDRVDTGDPATSVADVDAVCAAARLQLTAEPRPEFNTMSLTAEERKLAIMVLRGQSCIFWESLESRKPFLELAAKLEADEPARPAEANQEPTP